MARWEPNAPGRLEQAALELFEAHGYEQTTVEDIAQRAGVTKRTFFRHYPDKREVLFSGSEVFLGLVLDGLAGAPGWASPLEAVGAALDAVGEAFRDRQDYARRRQAVISANPSLLERELAKLVTVAAAITVGLRERGVEEPVASVTAETGMAILRNAFVRWGAAGDGRDLADYLREGMAALQSAAVR